VRNRSPFIIGCLIVVCLAALTPAPAEAQRRRPVPPGRAVSTAVPRGSVRPPYASPRYYHPGYGRYYYPRYYSGYYYPRYYYPGFYPSFYSFYPGYYYPGFSFSVGFGFGYGHGYPYYGGYGGYPWGYYGAYPYAPYGYDNSSALRLQVTPRDAEVYVDGRLAGRVDSFDGTFQRLYVEPGGREITVYHEQYRPFTEKLYVSPREGYKIQRAMEPLAPGEAAPPRPTPAPAASSPREREERMSRYPERDYPQQSRFGTLSIRVQPVDAEIYVDGERWEFSGARDRLVIELSEGPHRLEIRKEGLEPYATTVHIRPGEAATINVSLTRGSGAAAPRTNLRLNSVASAAGARRSGGR
jgi:PEGA domain